MFRRTVCAIVMAMLLTSTLMLASNVQPVKSDYVWTRTIYIRADGSVDPSTAPISSSDNVTYTLTDNITGNVPYYSSAIFLQRDNIIIDGANHTLQGASVELSVGIELGTRTNVTIKNTRIVGFHSGIDLHASNNNSISRNNVALNYNGIYLYSSDNNSISGNNVVKNMQGIWLDHSSNNNSVSANRITKNQAGIMLWSSSNNSVSANNIANNWDGIDLEDSSNNSVSGNSFVDDGLFVYSGSYGNAVTGNLVNGKRLVYLEGLSDFTVGDAGQVVLVKCNKVTVENLNLSYTTAGVELCETNNTIISGNKIANNFDGIDLVSSSDNNTVSDNNITANNNCGILLFLLSNNNSLRGNNIANNWYGIWVGGSYNRIYQNNLTNNLVGILVGTCNRIYHNNFVNNSEQVRSFGETNVWDDGYPSGGNYWSNYKGVDEFSGPYQNETGYDWIGDSPYVIDQNNTDRYPLMHPFEPGTQEIEVAYRNLLGYYNHLLVNLNTLNASYRQQLSDYSRLQQNYTTLQNNFNELLTQFKTLNTSYQQHLQNYTTLQTNYGDLQKGFNSLNTTYLSLKSNYQKLNSSYNNLNTNFTDYQKTAQNDLANIKNTLYVFTAVTVILAAAIAFVAVRKPKTKHET